MRRWAQPLPTTCDPGEQYLHGLSVLDQNGPQLSIELKENLPLASTVQVAYGQGFDVQRLAPLQLHLESRRGSSELGWRRACGGGQPTDPGPQHLTCKSLTSRSQMCSEVAHTPCASQAPAGALDG